MKKPALKKSELVKALGARVADDATRAPPQPNPNVIDKAFLEQEIANLTQQHDNAAAVMQQANGAIKAYRALIARLDQED